MQQYVASFLKEIRGMSENMVLEKASGAEKHQDCPARGCWDRSEVCVM